MSRELDPRLAERLVLTAMCRLNPTPGNKVLCMKSALHEAFLAIAREAHEVGYPAGHQAQHGEILRPGNPSRPAWIRTSGLTTPRTLPSIRFGSSQLFGNHWSTQASGAWEICGGFLSWNSETSTTSGSKRRAPSAGSWSISMERGRVHRNPGLTHVPLRGAMITGRRCRDHRPLSCRAPHRFPRRSRPGFHRSTGGKRGDSRGYG